MDYDTCIFGICSSFSRLRDANVQQTHKSPFDDVISALYPRHKQAGCIFDPQGRSNR